jgi:hypothetical protein
MFGRSMPLISCELCGGDALDDRIGNYPWRRNRAWRGCSVKSCDCAVSRFAGSQTYFIQPLETASFLLKTSLSLGACVVSGCLTADLLAPMSESSRNSDYEFRDCRDKLGQNDACGARQPRVADPI